MGGLAPRAAGEFEYARVMRLVALAMATSLGVGYVPVAPGTVGSLVGLALWVLLPTAPVPQLVAIAMLFVAGAWSAGACERHLGRPDPSQVVIDEVMGMLITLWMNPVGWVGAGVGFLFFRLFDVIKPYPANRLEDLHGGVGVMADDAMAAIYANLALRAVLAGAAWMGWQAL